jgi:hypothetical protein
MKSTEKEKNYIAKLKNSNEDKLEKNFSECRGKGKKLCGRI